MTASTPDGNLSASCTNSAVFDSSKAKTAWHLMGYITNNADVTQPVITFNSVSGTINNTGNRLYIDAFKFTEINPCSGVAGDVVPAGPLAAGQTYVNVLQVDAAATSITVYADDSLIGELTSGIVAGSNSVPTTALVKDSIIKASQTKLGCTSSRAGAGLVVGGGANPTVKAFLSCWRNPTYAGPIGTNSAAASIYYCLKGTGLTFGSQTAPKGGATLDPSQCWQTVTFDHTTESGVQMDNAAVLTTFDPYCALDGLVFTITDPIQLDPAAPDSGPYDIYVDQIMNGDVVIENFESYAPGTTSRFNAPKNQAVNPNPVAAYITGPNSSTISTNNAFDGAKSCRVQWQWNGTSNVRWARVQANATTGKNYPQLDTSKPITIRYLVLPIGQTTNKLSFTSIPANRTNSIGDNATLTVGAVGEAPFTYQWQYAGSDITGETTSSYTKSNLQLADTGTYSVIVTGNNGTGCVATNSATLTVTDVVTPVRITYTVDSANDTVTLNWTGAGHILQSAADLNGSPIGWQDVPGNPASGYQVNTANGAKYFRLRHP